jgi:hypothetical protein
MNVDRREINRLHLAAEGLMSAVFELSPLRYSAHASERFYSPSERPVTFRHASGIDRSSSQVIVAEASVQ